VVRALLVIIAIQNGVVFGMLAGFFVDLSAGLVAFIAGITVTLGIETFLCDPKDR
jgi:hypothetical protein